MGEAERRPATERASYALYVLLGPALAVGLALAALGVTRPAAVDSPFVPTLPSATPTATLSARPSVLPGPANVETPRPLSSGTTPTPVQTNSPTVQPTAQTSAPTAPATTATPLPTLPPTRAPTLPPTPLPTPTAAPTLTLPPLPSVVPTLRLAIPSLPHLP
jgi:hypothetical protein